MKEGVIRLVACLALFLLAGCWTGPLFYSASEARPAIAPGFYKIVDTDSPAGRDPQYISLLPDGMTRIAADKEGREPVIAGFAPLGGDGRFFVAWFTKMGDDAIPEDSTPYGLLERRDADYLLLIPECKSTTELATSLGARVEPDPKMAQCRFPDRASLEAGLRKLMPAMEGAMRLVPAGH